MFVTSNLSYHCKVRGREVWGEGGRAGKKDYIDGKKAGCGFT